MACIPALSLAYTVFLVQPLVFASALIPFPNHTIKNNSAKTGDWKLTIFLISRPRVPELIPILACRPNTDVSTYELGQCYPSQPSMLLSTNRCSPGVSGDVPLARSTSSSCKASVSTLQPYTTSNNAFGSPRSVMNILVVLSSGVYCTSISASFFFMILDKHHYFTIDHSMDLCLCNSTTDMLQVESR